MILCVVCPPGLQEYVSEVDAVNITDCPAQSVVEPVTETVGTGALLTLTFVATEVEEQLFTSVSVTV